MSKDISINEFYSGFCEEIALAQDVETYGWEPQDFFTAVMLGYLEEAGEIEDPIICPFRGYGLQLNAYHISESYDEVDVFEIMGAGAPNFDLIHSPFPVGTRIA